MLDNDFAGNWQGLEDISHWGVPILVLDPEPFFGQDRVERILWRMGDKELVDR